MDYSQIVAVVTLGDCITAMLAVCALLVVALVVKRGSEEVLDMINENGDYDDNRAADNYDPHAF